MKNTRRILTVLLIILSVALAGTIGWIVYDMNVDRSGFLLQDGIYYYQDFHARLVTGWQDMGTYEGDDYINGGAPYTMYGYAGRTQSKEVQEENEEIEFVMADREEVKRILEEEPVSIMCAYMMMHFLHAPEGHVFDFLQTESCNSN